MKYSILPRAGTRQRKSRNGRALHRVYTALAILVQTFWLLLQKFLDTSMSIAARPFLHSVLKQGPIVQLHFPHHEEALRSNSHKSTNI